MTTLAQKEANRRNAQRSTGPKTLAGKAISRRNALKEGYTGEGVVLTLEDETRVEGRIKGFRSVYRPSNEVEEWYVRRAAIETVRMDRCYREENAVRRQEIYRARLNWAQDHEVKAAKLGARLSEDPEVVSLELHQTIWGVFWVMDRWERLRATLETGTDWTEEEQSLALDLLGVHPTLRNRGFTRIDPPSGIDPIEHRQAVIDEVMEDLGVRCDGPLVDFDIAEQELVANDLALIDNARLQKIRRFESNLQRRFYQAHRSLVRGELDGKEAATRPVAPKAPAVPKPDATSPGEQAAKLFQSFVKSSRPQAAAPSTPRPAVPQPKPPSNLNRRERRALKAMERKNRAGGSATGSVRAQPDSAG